MRNLILLLLITISLGAFGQKDSTITADSANKLLSKATYSAELVAAAREIAMQEVRKNSASMTGKDYQIYESAFALFKGILEALWLYDYQQKTKPK
jgi:hypothetical protein